MVRLLRHEDKGFEVESVERSLHGNLAHGILLFAFALPAGGTFQLGTARCVP